MAFLFSYAYSAEAEAAAVAFYATLSEKDQRRYIAVEAKRMGFGGIEYVAGVFQCSRKTVERGIAELDQLPNDPAAGRVRRPGGGRKKVDADPQLKQNLTSLLQERTAGNPDDDQVVYTELTPPQMAAAATQMGTPVSPSLVRDWLAEQGLALHKIAKVLAGGEPADRDTQFVRIANLKAEYLSAGNPVFSIDTKAKEHLGQLFRAGRIWTQKPFQAFDHDFPSWATGVIIPHGIYDVARNLGHINIGLSHDTSAVACDSFRWFWNRIGQQRDPHATAILWLCDCGGSNAANQYLFKHDLQQLADAIGLPIRVAHYPSYCSKYNPADRRFFPHVSRACHGMLFDTIDTVVRLMRRASTSTGLRTTVNVIRKVYETGRKLADEVKENLRLVFDDLLPKWNYTAIPNQ